VLELASKWKLTQIWAILLVFPFLVLISFALHCSASNPPIPSAREAGEPQQPHAASTDNNSGNFPAVKGKPVEQNHRQGSDDNTTPKDAIEIVLGMLTLAATIAIALFNRSLSDSTKKLWEETRNMASFANEQIGLARAEFDATHRPRIRIKHVWLQSQILGDMPLVFRLIIVNVGDAPAKITDVRYGCALIPTDNALPQEPDFRITLPYTLNKNIGLGDTWEFSALNLDRVITHADSSSLREGLLKLHIFGHVQYTDGTTSGGLKNTAFCRVLNFQKARQTPSDQGRLEKHTDPDYEYED
jgi:hypothetical protein